ncbi:unnamed protein product, partial [marine sediment metagenome]
HPLNRIGTRAKREHRKPGGVLGRFRFDRVDLDTANVIEVRETGGKLKAKERGGGRGKTPGIIKTIEGATLTEIRDSPEYADIADQMRHQAKRVLEILGEG